MFLKTQVIVNPESNKGQTRKRWTKIKEVLQAFFKEFKYDFTEKPNQASEISRLAIKDGTDLIVGVGGDGTMSEIANGFFEDRRLINPATVLGIVPSGNGNDFVRSLNIPSGLINALKAINEAPSAKIDIGKARYTDMNDQEQERYFLNVSDFGIGGEVVNRMDREKRERKKTSYLRCLVSTFVKYKAKRLRILVDGRELPLEEYMTGAIANGKIFGKGMRIAPEAELDDGRFDLVLIKGMKIWEFLRNVNKLYRGTHLSHPKISLIKSERIEAFPADGQNDVLIEIDGEQLGKLPAVFEIMPKSFAVKGYL